MQEIKEEYGNDAFYIQYGTGVLGAARCRSRGTPTPTMFARLMNLWGGYLRQYADYSTGQITWEMPLCSTATPGQNNEVTDLVNSKNIVLFGNNPANTRMCGSAMRYLHHAGAPAEPRGAPSWWWTRTCRTRPWAWRTSWLPIRPGTDIGARGGHDPVPVQRRQAGRAAHPRQVRRLLLRQLRRRRESRRAHEHRLHGARQVRQAHHQGGHVLRGLPRRHRRLQGHRREDPRVGRRHYRNPGRHYPRVGRPVHGRSDGHHSGLGPAASLQRRQQLPRHRDDRRHHRQRGYFRRRHRRP